MGMMQRTFRSWRRPWWQWRAIADRRDRLADDGGGAPVELSDLTLNTSTVTGGAAAGVLVGTLQGTTDGSTLSITDTAGTRFALDGETIETGATPTDYGTATSHNITVREELTGATNTPNDSVIAITVLNTFSPLDISPTAWWDPSDLSTLFQDAAMTTPVTADGDVIGAMMDKSGNGRHLTQATTANKKLYKTSGGLHWIEPDGVDDNLGRTPWADATVSTMIFGLLTSDTAAVVFNEQVGNSPDFLACLQSGSGLAPDAGSGTPTYHANNGAAMSPDTRGAAYTLLSTGSARVVEVRSYTRSAWIGFVLSGYTSIPLAGRIYGIIMAPEATMATGTNRADVYSWMADKAGVTL